MNLYELHERFLCRGSLNLAELLVDSLDGDVHVFYNVNDDEHFTRFEIVDATKTQAEAHFAYITQLLFAGPSNILASVSKQTTYLGILPVLSLFP